LQNLSILSVKLAGDDFFDGCLGLVEELVAWVVAVGEVGDEVAGLEGHVELELGDVVAEVFAGLLGDDLGFQVHGGGLLGICYGVGTCGLYGSLYYLGWDGGSLEFFKDVYVGWGECYESVICFFLGGCVMFGGRL
jgi:hypothetical protein